MQRTTYANTYVCTLSNISKAKFRFLRGCNLLCFNMLSRPSKWGMPYNTTQNAIQYHTKCHTIPHDVIITQYVIRLIIKPFFACLVFALCWGIPRNPLHVVTLCFGRPVRCCDMLTALFYIPRRGIAIFVIKSIYPATGVNLLSCWGLTNGERLETFIFW